MVKSISLVIIIDENRSIRVSNGASYGDVNLALLYKGEVQAGIDLLPSDFKELREAINEMYDILGFQQGE